MSAKPPTASTPTHAGTAHRSTEQNHSVSPQLSHLCLSPPNTHPVERPMRFDNAPSSSQTHKLTYKPRQPSPHSGRHSSETPATHKGRPSHERDKAIQLSRVSQSSTHRPTHHITHTHTHTRAALSGHRQSSNPPANHTCTPHKPHTDRQTDRQSADSLLLCVHPSLCVCVCACLPAHRCGVRSSAVGSKSPRRPQLQQCLSEQSGRLTSWRCSRCPSLTD